VAVSAGSSGDRDATDVMHVSLVHRQALRLVGDHVSLCDDRPDRRWISLAAALTAIRDGALNEG
jgi:hypothetical protein